jgi:hypothetical protein
VGCIGGEPRESKWQNSFTIKEQGQIQNFTISFIINHDNKTKNNSLITVFQTGSKTNLYKNVGSKNCFSLFILKEKKTKNLWTFIPTELIILA